MSSQTIPGILIDLSSNNPHPIDYQAAASAGVIAVFIKATDGVGYTNPYYGQDAAGFAAVGIPTLAYHFAEFGDVAAEAAHFLAVAGTRARVLDSETSQDFAWQNQFLAELNLPLAEELDYGSASTLQAGTTILRAMLWPASYGKDFGFGDVWQNTDAATVAGIGGQVDASIWIGPPAHFYSLFGAPNPNPTNQETIIMGLPTGCTDTGAINAFIRETYNEYSTNPMTTPVQDTFRAFYNLPQAQQLWGKNGYGGNPDLLLAGIVDAINAAGHLRPERQGSV